MSEYECISPQRFLLSNIMFHFQSPDEIDTDTEIEYEDDYEYETRSKCERLFVACYGFCSFPHLVRVRTSDSDLSVARVFSLVSASYVTDQDDVLYEEKSDRAMMRQLPAEDRAKIQTQVEEFRMEKVF